MCIRHTLSKESTVTVVVIGVSDLYNLGLKQGRVQYMVKTTLTVGPKFSVSWFY